MTPFGIDHLVLEVANVDRSLAFYHDLLGLPCVRLDEFRAGTAPFVSLRVGSSLIDLFVSPTPGKGPHHFCLEFFEDIETLLSVVQNAGWNPGLPQTRYGAKGAGQSFYLVDPDGHRVEIRSYAAM